MTAAAAAGMAGWAIAVVGGVLLALTRRERRRRAELVVRACHELRGPLQAAALALHAAAREADRDTVLLLAAVEGELGRAGLAIADLSGAPGGRAAPDRPEVVDLGAMIAAQLAVWRALACAGGCALAFREPPAPAIVVGDRLRLAQAIANLVANAVEHGQGTVVLRVREAAPGRVAVEVSDEGPGLAAPVAVLAGRARAGRGTRGRGLAIAAAIASRHGGRLAAAPAAQGARLVLDLPAAARPCHATPAPHAS